MHCNCCGIWFNTDIIDALYNDHGYCHDCYSDMLEAWAMVGMVTLH